MTVIRCKYTECPYNKKETCSKEYVDMKRHYYAEGRASLPQCISYYQKNEPSIEELWDQQAKGYLKLFPEAEKVLIINKDGHVIKKVERERVKKSS